MPRFASLALALAALAALADARSTCDGQCGTHNAKDGAGPCGTTRNVLAHLPVGSNCGGKCTAGPGPTCPWLE